MKPSLRDQLRKIKINLKDYGHLPRRGDVLILETDYPLVKQWEKLNQIRKNLQIANRYIRQTKGETLIEWAQKNNEQGISKLVLNEIGDFNNKTGGITVYFLNLQKFYDEQENVYDKYEQAASIKVDDVKKQASIFDRILKMRNEREGKRKVRQGHRKVQQRNLKKDGKGYLMVDAEPDKPTKETEKKPKKQLTPDQKEMVQDALKKSQNKKGIWIAGTLIVVTIIGGAIALRE